MICKYHVTPVLFNIHKRFSVTLILIFNKSLQEATLSCSLKIVHVPIYKKLKALGCKQEMLSNEPDIHWFSQLDSIINYVLTHINGID